MKTYYKKIINPLPHTCPHTDQDADFYEKAATKENTICQPVRKFAKTKKARLEGRAK
jgi:hypothetical protein